MKTFSCDLSEKDWKRLQGVKQNLRIKSDRKFMSHAINRLFIPTAQLQQDFKTVDSFYPHWIDNIAANLDKIRSDHDIMELAETEKANGGSAIVISGGPSVRKDNFRQIQTLAESDYKGTTICADSVLYQVLKNGITPDYVVSIDSQKEVSSFFDHDIVRENMGQMRLVSLVSVHPNAVDKWGGELYWAVGTISEKIFPNVTHTLHLLSKKTAVHTGGNVGSFGWILSKIMEKTPTVLMGMDFSYPSSTNIATMDYFPNYCQNLGGIVHYNKGGGVERVEFPSNPDMDYIKTIKGLYKGGRNPFFGGRYMADPVWRNMKKSFMGILRHTIKTKGEELAKTINCSEGGALYGKGIEQMYLEEFLRRHRSEEI